MDISNIFNLVRRGSVISWGPDSTLDTRRFCKRIPGKKYFYDTVNSWPVNNLNDFKSINGIPKKYRANLLGDSATFRACMQIHNLDKNEWEREAINAYVLLKGEIVKSDKYLGKKRIRSICLPRLAIKDLVLEDMTFSFIVNGVMYDPSRDRIKYSQPNYWEHLLEMKGDKGSI